jgi:two-component system chemotaxis response regulator CheV
MSIIEEVDRLTRLAGENRMELLLFQLAGRHTYGINVFKIREILPCPTLRHVPYAHRHVRGVMQTRGQTLPVVDLAAVLEQKPCPGSELPAPECTVIVTEYCGRVLGYLVRSVARIVNLQWEDIKPPPPLLGEANYMTAVTSIDGALVEIIDIERLLADIMGISDTVTEKHAMPTATPSELPQHVLIADDSLVARKQIARVMDQIGISYELVENGRLALEHLREAAADGPLTMRYGMIISDIEMPEMDGYTLTKAVKTDPVLQDLYLLLHTSLSGSFNHSMAASVGADRLLPKFDPDELAQAVSQVLTGTIPAPVAAVA